METQNPLLKDEDGEEVDYPKDSLFDLVADTDSDYARASLDRKSTIRGKAKKSVRLMMEKLFGMELELILVTTASSKLMLLSIKLTTAGLLLLVLNEVVHKELGDSLVRAATTPSSFEVEQDSGSITKTRSKATPNESSSLGTTSGGGPSDKDSLKLKELMELCTILQQRVLDLKKTKTTQQIEIDSLKRRVKKLEKKRRRRNNAIDADEDITLVNVQGDADNEMFDVDALNGEEVFFARQNENVVEKVVDAAQVKGIVFQEPSKSTTTTISSQQLQDKGKGIMIEEPVKPMKKKIQIMLDEEAASKLQAEFDEEERLVREKAKKEKEANVALTEEWDDIQAKIEAGHELAQGLQTEEQEELSDAEKATLFQQLLEKRRKHFAAKRTKDQRNKPPTEAQQRKIMCTYLKNMEGKKLKDLKNKSFDSIQKMFDRAFKRVNTFVDFRTDLVEGSSKRAREELEQESTKKQKVDEDKDTTKYTLVKNCVTFSF
ncbi:hypothetical protein Tco_0530774 [Tanacetum coccineum]